MTTTTYAELKDKVSRAIGDADGETFVDALIVDIIRAAWAEVSRVAPQRFQEDITPVADTLKYVLRKDVYGEFVATSGTTTISAATNLATVSSAHGYSAGDRIRFRSLTAGTGLTVGTDYYVIAAGLTSTIFAVSATLGGAAVDITVNYTAATHSKFFSSPVDDVEVQRVEIWDTSVTPNRALRFVEPQSAHPMALSYSQAGWIVWDGELNLPNRIVDYIAGHEATRLLRIWGYAPWAFPATDSEMLPFSRNLEEALVVYCNVEALRRLKNDRALFAQYQTQTNNTDISPAAIISDLNDARAEWRQLARSIVVLREAP